MIRRNAVRLSSAAAASVPLQNGDGVSPRPAAEITVYLKPSRSGRRRASLYIPRMRETKPDAAAFRVEEMGTALPLFAIASSSCEYYALRLPLLKAGFKRLPLIGGDVHTACNVLWGKSPRMARSATRPDQPPAPSGHIVYMSGGPRAAQHSSTAPKSMDTVPPDTSPPAPTVGTIALTNPFQKFNHYPGSHKNLGCKRGMASNIMFAERAVRKASLGQSKELVGLAKDMYAFSPRTWFYPEQQEAMIAAFKAAPHTSHFIWKPARGSCGRGIMLSQGGAAHAQSWRSVMREIEHRVATDTASRVYRHYVVQEYIEHPLLLHGRKMDLRLYVTVTSYNPLVVYLHDEGLVRLAAEPYADDNTTTSAALDTNRSVVPHEERPTTAPEMAQDAIAVDRPQDVSASFDILLGKAALPTSAATSAGGATAASDSTAAAQGRFRHLTNFSIGRRYQAFRQQAATKDGAHEPSPFEDTRIVKPLAQPSPSSPPGAPPATPGCDGPELKWSLQRLWDHLDSPVTAGSHQPRPSVQVKENIALLITRTLLAARPNLCKEAAKAETRCGYFELYGFDVMLDEQLQPYLVEINTLPSLESSSEFDHATKCNVVSDMLNLAMIEPFVRVPETLEPFTHDRSLLQPPPQKLREFMRDIGEQPLSLSTLPEEEQRREIQAQLDDELMYARGFHRIFPPVSSVAEGVVSSLPLTADTASMKKDVSAYAAFGMLSSLDKLALSL